MLQQENANKPKLPGGDMKVSRILQFIGGLIGGGFFGAGIAHVIKMNVENTGNLGSVPMWLTLACVVLLFYTAIAIHEAGHWLAGLGMRFRTLRISVGPLMMNRRNGKTSLLWSRGLLWTGGITAMVPDDDRNLTRRFGWFVAGGPLASIVTGAACFAVMPFMATSWLKIAVIAFGCICLLLTVLALIPSRSGGFHSDGARLLMLRRGGDGVKRLLAILQLVSESQGGTRPRDWSRDAIAVLAPGAPDGFDDTAIASLLYAHACDIENMDLARTILDRQLSASNGTPAPFRANWCLEAALFAARYEGDPVKAREWQKQGKGARLVDAVVHHMLEAEILFAERRCAQARQEHDKAVAALAKVKFLPKGYPIEERLGDLDQRIRTAESALVAA